MSGERSRPPTIAASLARIRELTTGKTGTTYPSLDTLREVWASGQNRGKVVVLDGKQAGDPPDAQVGMIVTTDDGLLIRIAMTVTEAANLAHALVQAA